MSLKRSHPEDADEAEGSREIRHFREEGLEEDYAQEEQYYQQWFHDEEAKEAVEGEEGEQRESQLLSLEPVTRTEIWKMVFEEYEHVHFIRTQWLYRFADDEGHIEFQRPFGSAFWFPWGSRGAIEYRSGLAIYDSHRIRSQDEMLFKGQIEAKGHLTWQMVPVADIQGATPCTDVYGLWSVCKTIRTEAQKVFWGGRTIHIPEGFLERGIQKHIGQVTSLIRSVHLTLSRSPFKEIVSLRKLKSLREVTLELTAGVSLGKFKAGRHRLRDSHLAERILNLCKSYTVRIEGNYQPAVELAELKTDVRNEYRRIEAVARRRAP